MDLFSRYMVEAVHREDAVIAGSAATGLAHLREANIALGTT